MMNVKEIALQILLIVLFYARMKIKIQIVFEDVKELLKGVSQNVLRLYVQTLAEFNMKNVEMMMSQNAKIN